MLNELRSRDATIGIVTGNVTEVCSLILESARLSKYFEFIIGGDTEPSRYRRLASGARHAGAATNGMYYFDDSYASIPISRELGIVSVAVGTGDTKYEKLAQAKPDYLFRDLSDTRKVLEEVFGKNAQTQKKVPR